MKYTTISVSAIAVLLSAVALAYSILSSERARECEFLYRTYDRLSELSRYTQREEEHQMQCRRLVEEESDEVDSMSAEEIKMCYDVVVGTEAGITKSKWELELHRVSFESTALFSVLELGDNAISEYENRESDQEGEFLSVNWLRQFVSASLSAAMFREEMILLVEGAMKTTAESIRGQCR